jgi:hypothetical protein
VHDRVVLCLGLLVAWVTCPLPTTCDYYYHKSQKNDGREIVTRQRFGMGIGGCNKLCLATTGHSLIALLSLSASIKDRSLHGP